MTENKGAVPPEELTARQREVLHALLDLYLDRGEPVASHQVAEHRHDGLSSATIRSVLVALEADGYLRQPHTSAGRVPTLAALRYYIPLRPPLPLSPADEALLQEVLAGTEEGPGLWERASQFLSRISQGVGVVAVAPWADPGLRQIRFFRLTDRRVLAILVTADQQVRERVARVPEDYTQEELEAAARFLNSSFGGWKLEGIRRELSRRLDEDRAAYDRLLQRVLVLYHCGVAEMQAPGQVYLEGTDRLLVLLRNHERLGDILAALAAKERLLALLTSLGEEASQSGSPLRVQVGLEQVDMPDFSLVAAPYQTPDHQQGAVGILGPARMEYERAMGAVLRVRELFSQVLKDN